MTVSGTSASPAGRSFGAPTPDQVAALCADPRFPAARRRIVTGLVGHFRGNRIVNRVLNDRGRILMGLLILDLHFNGEADGGLTATRLKQVCAETGVCSPGRVTAMLGIMRLFDFITDRPGPDRRVRRLVPTGRLLAVHRERWRHFFEALSLLGHDGAAAQDRLDDPAFVAPLLGAMAGMFRGGMRVTDYVPELAPIVRRDGGLMIVLSIALAGEAGRADAAGPVDLTISAMAKRFAVSRGHVLSVLRDAEQQGLITRTGPRGEGISATPALRDTVDRFAAAALLIHVASVRAALSGFAAPNRAYG
ncbi:hypothetical protein [Microbaculum marinum]|uniref:MarR family transcriptional regulator n=1 Tax=Microbaculum marinum TaxID=1764581 RepID=A0AAW9RNR2_9HYPH